MEWNGYTRASLFCGGENYDYAAVFGEFALQSTLDYKSSYLHSDIRFRGGSQFGKDTVILQLKELNAGYRGTNFHIFLGNQIVQWGRTDGFNPTNNITPNDYFFLSAEPDDQKLSNTLLRFKYFINSQIEFDLIAIPVYRSSAYRYDLFAIMENAEFIHASVPDLKFKNGTIAGRLNFEFTKAGFSISYFNGFDPFYGFRIDEIDMMQPSPVIRFIPDFYRKQTLGSDFALFPGKWILRGELAYNHTTHYKDNMHIPNPGLAYVFGLEHNFLGITAIFQYIGNYTSDFIRLQPAVLIDPNDPQQQIQYYQDKINYEAGLFDQKIFNQQKEFNHALFLSVNKTFIHEIFQLELSGYYNITSEEYLIRPTLKWKITDSLESRIGGNYMNGPGNSVFSLSKPVLNGVFLELRVNF